MWSSDHSCSPHTLKTLKNCEMSKIVFMQMTPKGALHIHLDEVQCQTFEMLIS